MRFLLCILFLSTGLYSTAQENELRGIVKSGNTFDPIIGAHIKNYSTKKLAITIADGSFYMPASLGDSVVISHVGYQEISMMVDESLLGKSLELILLPTAIHLEEVEVNVFPEYERFKQLVLETEPVDSSITFDLPKVPIYDPRAEPIEHPLMPPRVIGARFDLEGLTKKGKEKKKYKRLLAQESMIFKANEKFNRDWIAAATKLEGDELTSFIEFCAFTPEYIVETPLFEINRNMMALLDEFRSQRLNTDKEDNRFVPG